MLLGGGVGDGVGGVEESLKFLVVWWWDYVFFFYFRFFLELFNSIAE